MSHLTTHQALDGAGTNTHAQIDSHIADTSIHFSTLAGHSDVTITSATAGELLVRDSGNTGWENQTLAEAGIAAAGHTHALNDLTDATITAPATDDILKYSGGAFVNSSTAKLTSLDVPTLQNTTGQTIDITGYRISGSDYPQSDGDLVNKVYADNLQKGMFVKTPVRAVAVANDLATRGESGGLLGAAFAYPNEKYSVEYTFAGVPTSNQDYIELWDEGGSVHVYFILNNGTDTFATGARRIRVDLDADPTAAEWQAATIAAINADSVGGLQRFTAEAGTAANDVKITLNTYTTAGNTPSNGGGGTPPTSLLLNTVRSGVDATLTLTGAGQLAMDTVNDLTVNERVLVREAATQQVTWVIDAAESGGNYDGTYITFAGNAAPAGNADLRYIWFSAGGGSDPAPAGATIVGAGAVSFAASASAVTIADAIRTRLNADAAFTCDAAGSATVVVTTDVLVSAGTSASKQTAPIAAAPATVNRYYENGAYTVTKDGAGNPTAGAAVLTRAYDADGTPLSEVQIGSAHLVTGGAENQYAQYVLTGTAASGTTLDVGAEDARWTLFAQAGTAGGLFATPLVYEYKVNNTTGGNITAAGAEEVRLLNTEAVANSQYVYNGTRPHTASGWLGLIPGSYRVDCEMAFRNVGSVACRVRTNATADLTGTPVTEFQSSTVDTDTGFQDGTAVVFSKVVTVSGLRPYLAMTYIASSKPTADGLGKQHGSVIGDEVYARLTVTPVSVNAVTQVSTADIADIDTTGVANNDVLQYNSGTGKFEASSVLADITHIKPIVLVEQSADGESAVLMVSGTNTVHLNAVEALNGVPDTTYLTNVNDFALITTPSTATHAVNSASPSGTFNPVGEKGLRTSEPADQDRFTLAAGTYFIEATKNVYKTNRAIMLLVKDPDGTPSIIITGASDGANDASNVTGNLYLSGEVTIGSATTFLLRVVADVAETTLVPPTTGAYHCDCRVVIQPVGPGTHTHRLADFSDIAYTSVPQEGDTLVYNGTTKKWQQSTASAGDIALYEDFTGAPLAVGASATTIPYLTELEKTGTAISAPVSGVFTVSAAGTYRVAAKVDVTAITGAATMWISVNDSDTTQWGIADITATGIAAVSADIPLVNTDTLRVKVLRGTALTIDHSTARQATITIERLRSNTAVVGGSATLRDLTDTLVSAPADGQLMRYNGTSAVWENFTTEKIVVEQNSTFLMVGSGANNFFPIHGYTLRTNNGFSQTTTNQLTYTGSGGVFLITASCNYLHTDASTLTQGFIGLHVGGIFVGGGTDHRTVDAGGQLMVSGSAVRRLSTNDPIEVFGIVFTTGGLSYAQNISVAVTQIL